MPGLFPEEDDESQKWQALLGMPSLTAPMLQDQRAQELAHTTVQALQPQGGPPGEAQADLALNQYPPLGHAENRDKPAPEMEAWQALAGVGGPPQFEAPGKGGLILAMFADALLNKGRSLGPLLGAAVQQPDTELANYKLRMQDAKDRAGIAHMMRGPGAVDPEVLRLRAEANELRRQGQGISKDRLELDKTRHGDRQENREEDQKLWDQRYGVGGVREQVSMNREVRAADEWDRRANIAEENKIGSEERALGRELYKEERESNRSAEQAAIPGWRNKQGFAPNKDNAKQAREIADALGELEYFSNKLKETHGELNGLQAKLGANFNAFLGSDEAAQKLVDANIYHQHLLAAGRKLQNMGVPQLYELQMLEKGMPRLDSLTGVLNAGRAYSTVGREAQLQAQRRMGVFGYEPDSGPAPQEAQQQAPGLGVTSGAVPKVNEVQPPAGGMVRMRDPQTGKEMMVPAQNVETAKARGLEVVQ